MQEEIKKALLPIIHYQVDLWACEVSGRKFLGTHVHYVDSSFNLQHALLGVSITKHQFDCCCWQTRAARHARSYGAVLNTKIQNPKGPWEVISPARPLLYTQ